MVEHQFAMLVAVCSAQTEDDRNYIVVYGGRDEAGRTWMWIRGQRPRHWYSVDGYVGDAADVALRFNQEAGWAPIYVDATVRDELLEGVDWSCPTARA
jgi:hypothetical protein